jgi:hypothetical protein
MKILKEKSREYNGKPYYKYKINLPEISLKEAGFQSGDELEVEAKKGEIKLKRKKLKGPSILNI